MQRLFGLRAVVVYRLLFAIVVFVGCITELKVAWTLADVTNGLMALPNLIGLILASGLIARETRAYLKRDPKLQESA